MDVGLDELIQKKWRKGLPGKKNRGVSRNIPAKKDKDTKMFGGGRKGVGATKPVIDARAKIIARKRTTLRDAREKLNSLLRQKDMRSRLTGAGPAGGSASVLGSRLGLGVGGGMGGITGAGGLGKQPIAELLPRRTIRNPERNPVRPRPLLHPLVHPPQNYPTSFGVGRSSLIRRDRLYRDPRETRRDDLMDTDASWDPASLPQLEVRLTRPSHTHTISHHQPPPQVAYRQRELLPSKEDWVRPPPLVRRNEDNIKSRLEPLRQEEGYRIVVSNLQPTVTHEDIKELFEDIGPLIGSRVVRPGTAEVVYRELKDVVKAVDTYHNRQLDGQPMKCLLVKPSASAGTKGFVGSKGTVVPDLSTIHKALFMK